MWPISRHNVLRFFYITWNIICPLVWEIPFIVPLMTYRPLFNENLFCSKHNASCLNYTDLDVITSNHMQKHTADWHWPIGNLFTSVKCETINCEDNNRSVIWKDDCSCLFWITGGYTIWLTMRVQKTPIWMKFLMFRFAKVLTQERLSHSRVVLISKTLNASFLFSLVLLLLDDLLNCPFKDSLFCF